MLSRSGVTYLSLVDRSAGNGQSVALRNIKSHSDGFERRSWEWEVFAAPSWISRMVIRCITYVRRCC
jgi:hypothetical protein